MRRIKAKYFGETDPLEPEADGVFDDKVFNPTQTNKPSPIGILTYSQWLGIVDWTKWKQLGMTRSYTGWTNSMEPSFDHGDMLLKVPYTLWKARFGKLTVGQIAIYQYGSTRIVHRCVGIHKDGRYIFKGDNNKTPDALVSESQIQDVVVGILFTHDKRLEKQD
jgi:signal peptidase I